MEYGQNPAGPSGRQLYAGDKAEVDLVGSLRDGRPYGFVNGNRVVISDADGYCQPGDRIDAVLSESMEDGSFLADFADYKACFLEEYAGNEERTVRAVITGRNKYDFRDAVSLPWRMENGGVFGVPAYFWKTRSDIGAEKEFIINRIKSNEKGLYRMHGRAARKKDRINPAATFHIMETMIETYEPDYNTLRNVHGIPNDIFAAVFLGGERDNFIISKTMTKKYMDPKAAIEKYLQLTKNPSWSTKLLLSWDPDELDQAKRFIEYYYGMEIDHIKESDF